MPEKISFTKENLDAVQCQEGKPRRWVYDTKTAGLALMATATGAKSFYLYRWLGGKPERIRLGGYPEMTPEQARKAAQRENGKIAEGVNPADVRRARHLEMTVEDLFKDWLARHAKVHKKSWKRDEENVDLHFGDIKGKKLSQLRRSDVTTWHTRLGEDVGPYLANRMLALLSTLFGWADEQHDYPGKNPCKGVTRFKEQSRERFLHPDELPKFFAALKDEPSDLMRDYFWMLLLTGARRNNVAAMRWDQLNLERGEWVIPDTKGGFPVTLPLSDYAVKILTDRRTAAERTIEAAQKDGNEEKARRLATWVFPSYGAAEHLQEPKKAWAALLERAGLKDLRIHDLRRTLGSWQAMSGSSLPIIGKSLGHKNQATTAIYARLLTAPVKVSVDTATAAMLAAAEPKAKKVKSKVKGDRGKGRRKHNRPIKADARDAAEAEPGGYHPS